MLNGRCYIPQCLPIYMPCEHWAARWSGSHIESALGEKGEGRTLDSHDLMDIFVIFNDNGVLGRLARQSIGGNFIILPAGLAAKEREIP